MFALLRRLLGDTAPKRLRTASLAIASITLIQCVPVLASCGGAGAVFTGLLIPPSRFGCGTATSCEGCSTVYICNNIGFDTIY